MGAARCEFSDLPADGCSHCTGRTGHESSSSEPVIVATWLARYSGRCGWCLEQIQTGSRMGRDDQGNYVCEECLS